MKQLIFILTVFVLITYVSNADNRSVVTVGNKAILENEIKAQMGQTSDYKSTIERLIFEKLLIFQAEQEGFKATPEEIESEIAKIKLTFTDETTFWQHLSQNNISPIFFKQSIENRIKTNKLIRSRVVNKIKITRSELMEAMRGYQTLKELSYLFSLKWFNTQKEAEEFVLGFNEQKLSEMSTPEWLEQNKIVLEVLQAIEQIPNGGLTSPFKLNERFLVVFVKEKKEEDINDIEKLYTEARNIIYQQKFHQQLDKYIKELQATIPVIYNE
ncbi:SurA N-terminal domain-containing protein [bacterium]|nr:SurA N-terminal domain-containing protein [bacterium]